MVKMGGKGNKSPRQRLKVTLLKLYNGFNECRLARGKYLHR